MSALPWVFDSCIDGGWWVVGLWVVVFVGTGAGGPWCVAPLQVYETVLTSDAVHHCYELLGTDLPEMMDEAQKAQCEESKRKKARASTSKHRKAKGDSDAAAAAAAEGAIVAVDPLPPAEPAVHGVLVAVEPLPPADTIELVPLPPPPAEPAVDGGVLVAVERATPGLPAPLRPSVGDQYSLEEAKLMIPSCVGCQIQINRGAGWTIRYKGRVSFGPQSRTHNWGERTGLTSSQALGCVLQWVWDLHHEACGDHAPFSISDMLP